MQANSVNFYNDILKNGRYFYIPVYQRNYSWQEEQCGQLIKDIMMVYTGEYTEHFIGTIVWKADDGNSDNLSVIDGQQRLTTMFLLLLAMRHKCDNETLKAELDTILINPFTNQSRLTPIKGDNSVYQKIVSLQLSSIERKQSRVLLNYQFFLNYIESNNVDVYKLYQSISRLSAIKMELHQTDNPQIIFESINSTGMSLSIADLIRNFLLMNEDYSVQTELFERYWYQFEKKLGVDKLVAFFEHYLNLQSFAGTINRSNMYSHFKKYFSENEFTARTILEHLEPYIDVYSQLCDEDTDIKLSDTKMTYKVNKVRDDIIELENTTAYMFLMPTLLHHKQGYITDEELLHSFEYVLSYLFRRSLIGLGTNVLQSTFRSLFSQVIENSKKHGWINAFDYALVSSKANTRAYFPTDDEFYEALHTRNLYGKYKYVDYLLLSLENEGNKSRLESSMLSIEHVMPQTITKYWVDALGENWKELHEENVNDLGNLTLTSYNSELSNSDFYAKKTILCEERHIKLNDYFHEVDAWNSCQIINRGKLLANKALKIWGHPQVDESVFHQVQENRYNQITLSDLIEDYFTLKPVKVVIKDQEFNVNNIRRVFEVGIKYCMDIDKEKFINLFENSLDYSRKSGGATYFIFSKDESKVFAPMKVDDIYYDKNRSGSNLFGLMSNILLEFGINAEDVIIKYNK